MILFGILALFLGLVHPGSSLECVTCIDNRGSECSGNVQSCSSGEVCASAYRELQGGPFGIFRGCAAKSKCNTVGSFSFSGARVGFGVSCCNTDGCDPGMPSIPDGSERKNNVECQSCGPTGGCRTISCTGEENMCVTYKQSGTGNVERLSASGCGTESLCRFQSLSYTAYNDRVDHEFQCLSRGGSAASDGHVSNGGHIGVTLSNAVILSAAAFFLIIRLL